MSTFRNLRLRSDGPLAQNDDTPANLANALTNGAFQLPPHIQLISNELTKAACIPNSRVLVEASVRHGKSLLCSKWFPVWCLDHWPDLRFVLASYGAEFAAKWGREARELAEQHATYLRFDLAPDQQATHDWSTTQGGGMLCVGAGGPFTGRGTDCLVIDDPIKTFVEANSETSRQSVWDWYQRVAYTRLEPNASIILLMARWHDDDLAGRLKKESENGSGEKWKVISMPAIAEEHDVLGRKPGQALWPERYDEKRLAVTKKVVGTYSWASLYQQRPMPEGGGLVRREWFRYYDQSDEYYTLNTNAGPRRILKRDCWRFMSADLAFTDRTWSDYSVVQVWDVHRNMKGKDWAASAMVLVDQWRGRVQTPVVEDTLLNMQRRYKPGFIAVERAHAGLAVIQRFIIDGINVRGVKVDKTRGNKVTRMQNATVWMENEKVFFPTSAPWLGDYENELLSFPGSANDDQVDATSQSIFIGSTTDRWTEPKPDKLPPTSIGKLLGHDKILEKDKRKSPVFTL